MTEQVKTSSKNKYLVKTNTIKKQFFSKDQSRVQKQNQSSNVQKPKVSKFFKINLSGIMFLMIKMLDLLNIIFKEIVFNIRGILNVLRIKESIQILNKILIKIMLVMLNVLKVVFNLMPNQHCQNDISIS